MLITAVLMTLLCSSFLCYRASSSSVKAIKEELGSSITIKGNFITMGNSNNYNLSGSSYQEISDEMKGIVNALKEYASDDRVSYCDYSLIKEMTYDTHLEEYIGWGALESKSDDYLENYAAIRELISRPGKFTGLMPLYFYQVPRLIGISTEYNDFFQSTSDDELNYRKLNKGRFFTPEELHNGSHVCLVQKNSGYYDSDNVYHKFELGDRVSVFNVTVNNDEEIVQTDVYSFEIIGFFSMYRSGERPNEIIVPNKIVEDIQKTDEQLSRKYNCYLLSDEWAVERKQALLDDSLSPIMYINTRKKILRLVYPVIKVKDVRFADEIIKELKEKLPYRDIVINVDATKYEIIAGSIGTLETTSKMFVILCMVVSIVVLSLITVISVTRRRQEMGVYLALGEKRLSIVLRIIAEYMIIGILCIAIALVGGSRIAGQIGEDVSREYQKAHKDELEHRDRQTTDIVENFNIALDRKDSGAVIAIGGGIIAVTSLASAAVILAFNPRKILMVE